MRSKQLIIPRILYKYRSLDCDFTKQMLINGEVYFATTKDLKDPLEKFFRFINGSWVNDQNNRPKYLGPRQYTQYFLDYVRNEENEVDGILSLCEKNNITRMYEEYADKFNGICIGFEWEQFGLFFRGSCPLERNLPRKVIYQPPLEIDKQHVSPEKWLEILTTKTPEFSYENEWRMFFKKGKYSHDNIRGAIRQIIFGHNTSTKHIKLVKEWIKDLNDVSIFITTPNQGEPSVSLCSLDI